MNTLLNNTERLCDNSNTVINTNNEALIDSEALIDNIEKDAVNTINILTNQLILNKYNLLIFRLYKITSLLECDKNVNSLEDIFNININIKDIKFELYDDDDHDWVIYYTHTTDDYDANNYNYNDDSDCDTELVKKTTIVKFGKYDKYYINHVIKNTIHKTQFKIYRNSNKILRLRNNDYDLELDIDEQCELITKYTYNYDIPEWFALRVFKYLSDNDWTDEDLIKYCSIEN